MVFPSRRSSPQRNRRGPASPRAGLLHLNPSKAFLIVAKVSGRLPDPQSREISAGWRVFPQLSEKHALGLRP